MFDYDSMHASILTLRKKQIFFVGGSPKSGTTWLQLLLDSHPSVSCSGEGHFTTHLWRLLKEALKRHDEVIKTNNKELLTSNTNASHGRMSGSQCFWSNTAITIRFRMVP